MSNALERLRDCAELWSERPNTTVETKDLALMLAVVDAAQKRFDVWSRETYPEFEAAFSALTKDTGAA